MIYNLLWKLKLPNLIKLEFYTKNSKINEYNNFS